MLQCRPDGHSTKATVLWPYCFAGGDTHLCCASSKQGQPLSCTACRDIVAQDPAPLQPAVPHQTARATEATQSIALQEAMRDTNPTPTRATGNKQLSSSQSKAVWVRIATLQPLHLSCSSTKLSSERAQMISVGPEATDGLPFPRVLYLLFSGISGFDFHWCF